MSTKSKQGLTYIIQAINNIVEPKVASLRYDKTYRAKVTQQIDAGIYVVQINGKEYQLPYSGTLNIGDIVKVKAPLNNFSDIYIEALPGSGGGGEGGTTNYNDLTNKPILNTDNASSLDVNKEEIMRGTVSLHKVSKTGNYDDLNGLPNLDFIPTSQKGVSNGVATLGANSRVPTTQLPGDIVYDENYVHTDNNFTTPLLNKLNGIEAEAQVNKIELIKRNGVDLEIQNKSVNILVPLKTSELENDGDGNGVFITANQIASTTTLGLVKIGANLTITSDGTLSATGGSGGGTVSDTLPIGSVVEWYSETIPDNWLICNGQEISRTEYSELFSVLDTTYGAGDGSTTFNIPNMSSRFAVGLDKNDTDFNALGKVGGSKSEDITHNHTIPGHTHTTANHTLTIAEMPNHGHGLAISGGTTAGQIDRVALDGYDQGRWYSTVEPVGGSQPHNHGNTGSTPLTTNNNTTNTNISTLPPYITVYYIIKAKQSQAVVATVVDNLNSTSSIDALSANQGRVLKNAIQGNADMIDTLQDDILNLEDTRLEVSNIKAGANITLQVSGKDITISSTGGGGSSIEEVEISDVAPTEETVKLWVDTSTTGGSSGNILDKVYPVGSIYMSTVDISPQDFLGGTWTRYGKGKTLIGVDDEDEDFNASNKTGGEKTHILSVDEMPSHTHVQNPHNHEYNGTTSTGGNHSHNGNKLSAGFNSSIGVNDVVRPTGYSGDNVQVVDNSGNHTHTFSGTTQNTTSTNTNTGGGQAHNNLQPYITCYMWTRTA